MRSSLIRAIAAVALVTATATAQAQAADPVRFGLCYDLTKIYVAAVPQVAQAAKDFADLMNLRGGLKGIRSR